MKKELLKDTKPWVVITHANCMDGFGVYLSCLWYAHTNNLKKPKVIYCNYGDVLNIKDLVNTNVLIGDFSFDRDTLLKINSVANCLVVLDHHTSAKETLESLTFCHYDNNKSGARLVWEYLFKDTTSPLLRDMEIPLLIQYIEDRDLWKWVLFKSKEISVFLTTIDKTDIDTWFNLLSDNLRFQSNYKAGEAIVAYQNQYVKSKCKDSSYRLVKWDEYKVPFINTTTLISEVGNELAKEYPFVIMYFFTPDSILFSFRSSDDNVDLTKLGLPRGHKHAAGRSFLLTDIDLSVLFTTDNIGSYLKSIEHKAK